MAFGISEHKGERMPKIVFRGKTYYSVYEMPPNVRRAYEKEQKRSSAGDRDEKAESAMDPISSTAEPATGAGTRGLIWGILVALVVSGAAYLLSQLIP